jgi:glycosyltransferase involved in cell wall biosynthesis
LKTILVQRVLPIYRKEFFEISKQEFEKAGHSFELWVSSPSKNFSKRGFECNLPWMLKFPVISLPRWLGGFEFQFLSWRMILAADVVIVSDNLRCISNILVILLRRLNGKPVQVWGHGKNFQSNWMSLLFSYFRFRILRMADFNIVYTKVSIAPLIRAGFNQNRILVSENNIDTSLAVGLYPQHPEVLAFRQAHFLGDSPCVAFLGSWYSLKRPEILIEFGLALRRMVPQIQVLVIGGGEGLEVLKKHSKRLTWLKILGPMFGREKFVALSSARCLVVSGMAGLNIMDAMAVGLPVIIPQREDHSPEIAYLLDGINGLIVPDDITKLAEACNRLIVNQELQARLSDAARRTSAMFTLKDIANNFICFAEKHIDRGPVIFVYQRMLPYHQARFRAVSSELLKQGRACIAVQVASFDRNYGLINDESNNKNEAEDSLVTLFNDDYLNLKPRDVAKSVFETLRRLTPSVVFTPAPAFSEGAGALHYKIRHGGRLVLMDDAWSVTSRRSSLIKLVKKNFYGYMDGGFFPDQLHGDYFSTLNIPHTLQSYKLNVVGTKSQISSAKGQATIYPENFILFVGRLIERKGLDVLLRALIGVSPSTYLVVIGDGPERQALHALASKLGLANLVLWLGRCSNAETRQWMEKAQALVIPSKYEQWGLVVNEAWLSETLVLGSDTVGALRANYHNKMNWMMIPYGDVEGWQHALSRLLSLGTESRAELINESQQLAEKYSLALHTQSALNLISIPKRKRPIMLVGWLARCWFGRTVVW